MVGIAAIPAGLLFGSIWQFLSAETAFLFAGGLAAFAALLLRLWAWPVRKLDGTDNKSLRTVKFNRMMGCALLHPSRENV